jgi:hypothetical protein
MGDSDQEKSKKKHPVAVFLSTKPVDELVDFLRASCRRYVRSNSCGIGEKISKKLHLKNALINQLILKIIFF